MRTDEYKAGKLIVDTTLCDHEGGFWNFTQEEFVFDSFEPNTCVNHATGIVRMTGGAKHGPWSLAVHVGRFDMDSTQVT